MSIVSLELNSASRTLEVDTAVHRDNFSNSNETNTNATGNQSQTNATTTGNLTQPAATTTNDTAATPNDSGYSHGCSDAKISNLSERYVNQPGKGPSSHTSSFMQGYYNGYSACSVSSPPAQQPSSPNSAFPDTGCTLVKKTPNLIGSVENRDGQPLIVLRSFPLLLTQYPPYNRGLVLQQPTKNESWRYNPGFLQGVSGAELKTHHTQVFMSGYVKGITV